jgi:hypothetical protein
MENGVTADQLPLAGWCKGHTSHLRGNRAVVIDLSGHKIATAARGACGLLSPWSLPLAGKFTAPERDGGTDGGKGDPPRRY